MSFYFRKKHFLVLFLTLSFAGLSFAKMRYIPKTDVEVKKILEYYKSNPNDTSFILGLLQKTVNYKSIRVEGIPSDPISSLVTNITSYKITRSFLKYIHEHKSWLSKNTEENIKLISKDKDRIKDILGENSYTWAWFLMQLGSTDKSIKLLNKIFDDEYNKVMLMKRARYGKGRHPLSGIKHIYKTLVLVSTKKNDIKEKMRVIKTHLSNLPQSHIKT